MESDSLLNSIFLGEIATVHNYGAFIRIPGNRNQGLVHKSQVSKSVVDDVSEVLQKGERVWCKVIKIMEDGKISLSMKVVDQGSGRDLDPNGVQIHQDEQRRKSMPAGGGRRAITLEAVLKTKCSKCGVDGHLSKDCFQSAGGKVYELLPDDIDEEIPQSSAITEQKIAEMKTRKEQKRKKDKKHKKEKKKKRKKNLKSSSSETEDESDSSIKKGSKKRKKRERSRSRSPKKRKK